MARSGDRALLGLKDLARWERAVRALPTVAHWLDGDPIEDRIVTIAKIEDRHRDLRPDGVPVATGVVAVADAWACTNPSLGRGASIGMLHAQALRDTLRQTGPDDPAAFSEAFAAATEATVEPWYQATLSFDRHRLAEMAAIAEGTTYDPGDPGVRDDQGARARQPARPRRLPGLPRHRRRARAARGRPGPPRPVREGHRARRRWRDEPAFGPDRAELVALANA